MTEPGKAPRYDRIGVGYAQHRRADPRIAQQIHSALGAGASVANVGAGSGSYEPTDRTVISIEPSAVMAAQRARSAPAVRGFAHALPLHDDGVDAAMSVLSLHHWDDHTKDGVLEMRRVASGPVVIVTFDAAISGQMWLVADYMPELRELDDQIFPRPELIAEWLGSARIDVIPVARDCEDKMLGAFWAHPEWVLDPEIRQVTSGFARQSAETVARVEQAVRADLASGAWDARYGELRALQQLDVGLRLIVGN